LSYERNTTDILPVSAERSNEIQPKSLASHVAGVNHDEVYHYLRYDKLTASLVWEYVKPRMRQSGSAYVIFDSTVLDKSYSMVTDGVHRQWSGNVKAVIKGIGVVNRMYYESASEKWWVIDYRIFDPEPAYSVNGGNGRC
jgi:hypothetical protein